MNGRSAQFINGTLFIYHRLHYLRTGNKHLADLVYHKNIVADGRRIARPAGAWPHDDCDLGNHAGSLRIAQENIGITAQRINPLFDSRPAAVIDHDNRSLHIICHILNTGNLHGVIFSK